MKTNNRFYYKDNWCGNIHYFDTIEEARESAKSEDGVNITIFDNNGVAEFVEANGYVYP